MQGRHSRTSQRSLVQSIRLNQGGLAEDISIAPRRQNHTERERRELLLANRTIGFLTSPHATRYRSIARQNAPGECEHPPTSDVFMHSLL